MLLLLILAACGCSSYPRAKVYPLPDWTGPAFDTLTIGLPAPAFTLDDLAGQPWRLREQRGKVVVLVFASNTDPSYVGSLDAFNAEAIEPFGNNPGVLFVTIYSQESHPELAGGKHNPDVIVPGDATEQRRAQQPERPRSSGRWSD